MESSFQVFSQGENDDPLARTGANVTVQAHELDASDLLDDFL